MSLLDCATAVLANQNMNYLVTGESPLRQGNAHPNIAPYAVFPTKDGHVILAVGNDGQFERLCHVLGRDDLPQDDQFRTNPDRITHVDAMTQELNAAMASWLTKDLIQALSEHNVPAGPIHTIGQNFEDPQTVHRGMKITPQGIPGVRGPWKFSDATLALSKTAPPMPKA